MIVALCLLSFAPLLLAGDDPGVAGWRGDGSGVFAGGPPLTWDGASGKNILWRSQLPGRGSSQPVAGAGLVVVCCEPDHIMALRQKDGSLAWEATLSAVDSLPETEQAAVREQFHEAWTLLTGGDPYKRVGDGRNKSGPASEADKARSQELWNSLGHHGRDLIDKPTWCESGYMVPTPLIIGSRVIVRHATSVIAAFDLASGRRQWLRRPPGVKFRNGDLMEAPSPIMGGGRVIVTDVPPKSETKMAETANERLLALDPATGAEVWRSGFFRTAGWLCSTPTVMRLGDRELLVTGGGAVVDVATGKVSAEKTGWSGSASSPVVAGDTVVFLEIMSHGNGKPPEYIIPTGSRVYAVRYRFEAGVLKWDRVWEHGCNFERRSFSSPAIHRDRVWVSGDFGMVIDLRTGAVLFGAEIDNKQWKSALKIGGLGVYPSVVACGEHILQVTHNGVVRVFATDGKDLIPVAENRLDVEEFTAAAPIIVGDRLYLRTDKALYGMGDSSKANRSPKEAE